MATSKERDAFIAQLTRALPDQPVHIVTEAARLLLRHARSHGNVQEAMCNGHPACSSPTLPIATINRLQAQHEAWCEKREAQLERRIREICASLGLTADFQGDPRGYTVKVHLPTDAYNTLGGREAGWGVPQ